MPTETVQAEWIRDQVFLLRDRNNYPLVMTQPWGVNGADLLPLSLIGCVLWDIQSIMEKQRQRLTALSASAISLREDDPPWRFRRIWIHYRFAGDDLSEDAIRRAIDLSETKYCSTFATLSRAVEIRSGFEINGRPALEPPAELPQEHPVLRFHQALNAGDLEGMMACLAPGCVFENTYPPPDGARFSGLAEVRGFWQDFFQSSREPHFEVEEFLDYGERCALRWLYTWKDQQGKPGGVRGMDLYRVENGLIAEKLSYVKG